MKIQSKGAVSLGTIATSGQVFNWAEDGDGFRVPSGERVCIARQKSEDLLEIEPVLALGSDEEELAYWQRYFATDVDYPAILDDLAMPEEVVESCRGLRVLRQDWWDTMVGFVTSQNNNIPRISASVERMSDSEGRILPASALVTLLETDDCGLGYRRGELQAIAEHVAGGWQPLCLTEEMPYEDEMAELKEFKGIGPKVASCICLFGLGYVQSVPRDTWIKKAEKEYHIIWNERWGGIQQQFVFHWIRNLRARS